MNFRKPKFWDYPKPSFLSFFLYPLSVLFLIISSLINIFKSKNKFTVPVICVGNIYLGGTGKTPLSIEIFKILKSIGKNPAFIKKSYNYLYDEINMLSKIGKTFTGNNRKKLISSLVSSNYDIAIMDDGFQDITIEKNFSIICFSSKQGFGNGFVIPSGPLRESINSIKKADCILINGKKNEKIENSINKINKNLKIFYSRYKIKNLEKFQNKKFVAFAGIGNPENFFELLKENKINVEKTFSFPDHHKYLDKDFDRIKGLSNKKIITTEKDYNRLNNEYKKICEYIEVNLEIDNKDELINLIKNNI